MILRTHIFVSVSVTYLPSILMLCTFIYLIDLVGELFKVRDDEMFSERICQQHDVVAHTPTRKHKRKTMYVQDIFFSF